MTSLARLTHPAPDPVYPRIDLVQLIQEADCWKLEIIPGTPAANPPSPVPSVYAVLALRVGVPARPRDEQFMPYVPPSDVPCEHTSTYWGVGGMWCSHCKRPLLELLTGGDR